MSRSAGSRTRRTCTTTSTRSTSQRSRTACRPERPPIRGSSRARASGYRPGGAGRILWFTRPRSCPSCRPIEVHSTASGDDREPWRPRPTLGGSDYTSPEVYEQERERIWWGDWVCVGRTEEVAERGRLHRPRHRRRIDLHRRNARTASCTAFYNVCSHRGTKFVDDIEGTGNVRKAFVCPYHAWTYDLTGRLIGTPNVKEDELFDRSAYPAAPRPRSTATRGSCS